MAWKISVRAFFLLNERVICYTITEGGKFQKTLDFPGHPVFVKDIVFCLKTQNALGHIVWARVKVLKGLDCHSFITSEGVRYDAYNDFKVYSNDSDTEKETH